MMRLLLLRHGQSEWNAQGRWQGRADPPLTERGRRQARAAAGALPPFDLLVASTLIRARETALEISDVLGVGPPELHAGLIERNVGAFSGLTNEIIDTEFPGFREARRLPDGWEHDDVLLERVRATIDRLATQQPDGTVVAVAHGGVVYGLEASFGLSHERLSNLSGRWFYLTDGKLSLGERVNPLSDNSEALADQL